MRRPATVRAVLDPDHHAPPTSSPARQGRTLFTCTSARHIDATTPQPGKCGTCGKTLVPVEQVDHGLRAIAYYARQQAMPRAADKPERPPLYTCPTLTHLESTSDRPGRCPACGLDLLPIEKVGHASRAVAYWTEHRRDDSVRPEPPDDPRRLLGRLFTCPDIAHVEVTGLRSGRCPLCGLAMSRLDRIVPAHAIKAVEAFIRKVETARAGPTSSRPSATRPATVSSFKP